MKQTITLNNKPSRLNTVLLAAGTILVVSVLLAPITAVLALPFIVAVAIHHVVAMARTAGSPAPFAILLGLDILMVIVIVGSLFVNR